jgi:hypothetical protein
VFLIMGVLGFIPPFASGEMLVGIFLLGPLRGTRRYLNERNTKLTIMEG